ncbi:MAG TPA: UPF0280 family protein [Dongiaceae bacterium]
MSALATLLPDGRRLHLQHGPIDLVIEAFGSTQEIQAAYGQAVAAFHTVLPGLVAELAVLRRPLSTDEIASMPVAEGIVAQRMIRACWPHRTARVTPMAAVAGSVADHILAALLDGRDLAKAYVNNGGDIALHLTEGQIFDCGLVTDLLTPQIAGIIHLASTMGVGGIATSGAASKGRGGRSFSLGIADAVTVLASDAATADAAATVIANAVDLPDHVAIERLPALSLDPDSDLGERLVTVAISALTAEEVALALENGRRAADRLCMNDIILAAVLTLRGEYRLCGKLSQQLLAA